MAFAATVLRLLVSAPAFCCAVRISIEERSGSRQLNGADFARFTSVYFPNISHAPAAQAKVGTAQSLLELHEAGSGGGGAANPDQKVEKAMLLFKKNNNQYIRTWGEDRVKTLLKAQIDEGEIENLVIGYSPAIEDVVKLWARTMDALEESAASRPQGPCSEFPDSILTHIWRYTEADVLECVGAHRGAHEAEGFCDIRKKEVPHSSNISWTFTKCSALGAHTCDLQSGDEGCCCDEGKQWEPLLNKCVLCSVAATPTPGQTCKLRCSFLPEVSATLTCDGEHVAFQGAAPEGSCRWSREADDVSVESPLGKVTGMLRPVLVGTPAPELQFVRTFWGVPFGEPVKMFRRPEMRKPWENPMLLPDWYVNKTNVPSCDTEDHDDCLTLAVYVPSTASAKNLKPVMFWIPGDGFRTADVWGGGMYDGARYALKQDAVLVISNGRSHILGHWANPALAAEDPQHSTGNYGLMDQRLALEWIRDNIKSFGGDPARVTIGGHSSGGFSVNFHLFSPASRGLFSGAIAEGATADNGWYFQAVDEAVEFYGELGVAMGCPNDTPKSQVDCLRKLDKKDFLDALNTQMTAVGERMKGMFDWKGGVGMAGEALWSWLGFEGGVSHQAPSSEDRPIRSAPLFPILPVGPCVDRSDAGLPHPPAHLMKTAGAIAPVPIYYDYATDEGTVFSLMLFGVYPHSGLPSLTHASVDEILVWALGPEAGHEVIKEYPRTLWGDSPFTRLSEVITDGIFKCSNHRMAHAIASQEGSPPVYLAENTYWSGQEKSSLLPSNWGTKLLGGVFGAWHMAASQWVMGFGATTSYESWTPGQEAISNLMNCMYGMFLHCGSPDISSTQKCPSMPNMKACNGIASDRSRTSFSKFDAHHPKKFIINQKTDMVRIPQKESRKCQFWERHADSFHFVDNIIRR